MKPWIQWIQSHIRITPLPLDELAGLLAGEYKVSDDVATEMAKDIAAASARIYGMGEANALARERLTTDRRPA